MNEPQYVIVAPVRETLNPSGLVIEQGTYVIERNNAGQFLTQTRKAAVRPFVRAYRPARHLGIRWGETVLFVRPGGFGDLLFLTPVFRHLKEIGCRVLVACLDRYAEILAENTDVWKVVPYPVPVEVWDAAEKHVWLEDILEDGIDTPSETYTTPAVDLIARAAGVEIEDKTLRYDVTPEEAEWAGRVYPRNEKGRVGIQLEASVTNRTYPLEHLEIVAGLLVQAGMEVVLFGSPGRIEKAEGPFINLTADGLTYRQSCAVLATCDAVVAPDSSLCHVAGALGIPTVALYGPFLSQSRVAYAQSIHPINGRADCAPCNHHGNNGRPWPDGCPGWQTGRCRALENIPPVLVALQAEKLVMEKRKVEA